MIKQAHNNQAHAQGYQYNKAESVGQCQIPQVYGEFQGIGLQQSEQPQIPFCKWPYISSFKFSGLISRLMNVEYISLSYIYQLITVVEGIIQFSLRQ